MKKSENNQALFTAYQTAAWTGAAFAGKLKKFNYYIKDKEQKEIKSKAFTPAECREIDKKFI